MKLVTILFFVMLATATSQFAKKSVQEQILNATVPKFIKTGQTRNLLPMKDTLTLNSFVLSSHKRVEGSKNEYLLTFNVVLADEENTLYSGILEAIYNEFEETSKFGSAEITLWDARKSKNTKLPLEVEIPHYNAEFLGIRNIVKEVTEASDVSILVEQIKNGEAMKNLGKLFSNIQFTYARLTNLKIEYKYVYGFTAFRYDGTKTSAEALITITGERKGVQHTFDFVFSTYNFTKVADLRGGGVSIRDDKQMCKVLEDISIEKIIKNLQEKNLVPSGTGALTPKGFKCKTVRQSPYTGLLPDDETYYHTYFQQKFTLETTLENGEKIQIFVKAPARFTHAFGLLAHFEETRELSWELVNGSSKKDPLFPTIFSPATLFDKSNNKLAKQNAIPFDRETIVTLFNFIIKNQQHTCSELAGMAYTADIINVKSIEVEHNRKITYVIYGIVKNQNGNFKVRAHGSFAFDSMEEVSFEVTQKVDNSFGGKLGRFFKGTPQPPTTQWFVEYRRVINDFVAHNLYVTYL